MSKAAESLERSQAIVRNIELTAELYFPHLKRCQRQLVRFRDRTAVNSDSASCSKHPLGHFAVGPDLPRQLDLRHDFPIGGNAGDAQAKCVVLYRRGAL